MLGRSPCRVISAFNRYSVGDLVYPTGVFRDYLINRKLIELVPPAQPAAPAPEVETAAVEITETATVPSAARRRPGRPREHTGA
jgi:hypothetical protein